MHSSSPKTEVTSFDSCAKVVSFFPTDDLVRKMETQGVGEKMSLTEFEK